MTNTKKNKNEIQAVTGNEYTFTMDKGMIYFLLERQQLIAEQLDSEGHIIRPFETFEDMSLKKDLLKGIENYGCVEPYAVQKWTIVPLYGQSDVFVQVAECEPGRISAICIGILQKLNYDLPKCQAVILTPSVLSAEEIGEAMRQLGALLKVKVFVFGRSREECPDDVHVVVGLSDFVTYKWTDSWKDHLKVLFFHKPECISSYVVSTFLRNKLPSRSEYQVGSFSEVESKEVEDFIQFWMKKPVRIQVPDTLTLEEGTRRHQVVSVNEDLKVDALLNLYHSSPGKTIVVFVNDGDTVERLVTEIKQQNLEGVEILSTTGGMTQKDKDKMTRALLHAEGGSHLLISTKEWANGINLKEVGLVVNYDLPGLAPEEYLSCMCRFGREANVVNFVTGYDWYKLFDIQAHSNNSVIFEGSDLQPNQFGPAGFSEGRGESLDISKKQLLPGIRHVLFQTNDDETKPCVIWDNLKKKLKNLKIVLFAEEDHTEKLKKEGFNVYKTDDLKGFFQSGEDNCVLLVTKDEEGSLNDAHPRVPVVINCDLPSSPVIYNSRVAWCQKNGIAIHLVTSVDWLKVLHFQSHESIVGWPSNDFAFLLRRARREAAYNYNCGGLESDVCEYSCLGRE